MRMRQSDARELYCSERTAPFCNGRNIPRVRTMTDQNEPFPREGGPIITAVTRREFIMGVIASGVTISSVAYSRPPRRGRRPAGRERWSASSR